MSVKMSVKRTVLLLGTPLSGKTSILDSLTILQAARFEDKKLSLPSKRGVSKNILGEKKKEIFNINIFVEENDVDILEVKFIKMPSINLNYIDHNSKIKNKYDQIHEYFQFLSEEDINLNTILYVYDGSQPRIAKDDKIILQELVTYYGESILSNLIIVQSKSNIIKPLDYEQDYEDSEDCTRQLNAKIENLNSFYQKRFIVKRKLFCQIIEDVLTDISDNQIKSQSTKNKIREMKQNINRPEKKSIINIMREISYLDFGKIYLMERNKKELELKISNLPNYPTELTFFCKQCNIDYITNIDWLEVFYSNLLSHKTEINLYKKNKEIIEYWKSCDLAELDYQITIIAIERTTILFKKNLSVLKFKQKFQKLLDYLPIIYKFSPLKILEMIQEDGLDACEYITEEDISLILRNIITTITDDNFDHFKNFVLEVNNQKKIINLENSV